MRSGIGIKEKAINLQKWRDYNSDLLKSLFTTEAIYREYRNACLPSRAASNEADAFRVQLETGEGQLSKLESILERLDLYSEPVAETRSLGVAMPAPDLSKVFVVHGRDNDAKNEVARFLEHIGLKPIILNEQPNLGRHLLTKFQDEAEGVGFAVVLITPDDDGALEGEPLRKRARQNVVFELGFLIGKLGSSHVAALVKGEVERPSDFDGVGYIPLDAAGGWKGLLARELKGVDVPFNVMRVLDG
ncbi:MAG TPA: nucleotide-binding protein [Stellaceae bacterium]|nr:nucleotide-binding protein [Stellaceae bacterium]